MICPYCLKEVPAGSQVCPNCHHVIPQDNVYQQQKQMRQAPRRTTRRMEPGMSLRHQGSVPAWAAIVAVVAVAIICGVVTYMLMRSDVKDVDRELKAENEVPVAVAKQEVPDCRYPGESGGDWQFENFDWLTDRYVTYADIAGLSSQQLRLLRNSIYAIHGYIFKSADLTRYFSRFDWYRPMTTNVTPADFNKYEAYNVEFIRKNE